MDRHGLGGSKLSVNRDTEISLVFLTIFLCQTEESNRVNAAGKSELSALAMWNPVFEDYLPSSSAFS